MAKVIDYSVASPNGDVVTLSPSGALVGADGDDILPGALADLGVPGGVAARNYITEQSSLQWDWTEHAVGVTSCVAVADPSVKRWGNATLKVTPSAADGNFRNGATTITLDPARKLATMDVYIGSVVPTASSISVQFYNAANYSGASTTWSFNGNALRQGWNTLKMWFDDTNASATTPPTGTLAWGCSKSVASGGASAASNIGSCLVQMIGFSGVDLYFDGIRKGATVTPCLIMGFDATGNNEADDVFTKSGGVADYLTSLGIKLYFTAAGPYWDLHPTVPLDQARKDVLYFRHGWDCLPHFWNHGPGYPSGMLSVASAARSSNVVTLTFASLPADLTVGRKIYAMISGASPTDANGLAYLTVASATTMTYTATGADGTLTGTIVLSTKTEDVINADDSTRRAIMRHELVDLVRMLRTKGWRRGLHIGAYPTNSVGVMEVLQPICAEAGIRFFRSIKRSTAPITEFGVDNPLHFGSVEMGNSADSPTLQNVKDALAGAIGRQEHLWTYGHYILDETDPDNSAHANANVEYAPGKNGNPAAPTAGGWWYMGTLKKFINETVLPLVASGDLLVLRPSDWAANLGNIDGSH